MDAPTTPPPPSSWASDPENEVLIATLKMTPGAEYTLPNAHDAGVNRALYFFKGEKLSLSGKALQ